MPCVLALVIRGVTTCRLARPCPRTADRRPPSPSAASAPGSAPTVPGLVAAP